MSYNILVAAPLFIFYEKNNHKGVSYDVTLYISIFFLKIRIKYLVQPDILIFLKNACFAEHLNTF